MTSNAHPRMMTVVAPHFCAQALWRKRGSKWTCISAGQALHWMIGKPYHEVFRYLERKGWRVGWDAPALR